VTILRRRTPSYFFSLPWLIFAAILVAAASFLLALKGIGSVIDASLFNTPRGMILLVFCPLALLILTAFLLYGIIVRTLHTALMSRFLLGSFLTIAALVIAGTVPQLLMEGILADRLVNRLSSTGISASLESASYLAELYRNERYHAAENAARRYFTGPQIGTFRGKSDELLTELRKMDWKAAAYQIWIQVPPSEGSDGEPLWESLMSAGDSAVFLKPQGLDSLQNGFIPQSGESHLLRYAQTIRYGAAVYLCAYTSAYDPTFIQRVADIEGAAKGQRELESLIPLIPTLGLWLFFIFCLPTVLMVLVIAWHLCAKVSLSVLSLRDALSALASGGKPLLTVMKSKDELAQMGDLVNQIHQAGLAPKRPDKKAVLRL
jgi:hypothetical protein